jgi:hypothetical protein
MEQGAPNFHLARQLETVDAGHFNVRNQKVDMSIHEDADCFESIGCGEHCMLRISQDIDEDLPKFAIVIGNEDSFQAAVLSAFVRRVIFLAIRFCSSRP